MFLYSLLVHKSLNDAYTSFFRLFYYLIPEIMKGQKIHLFALEKTNQKLHLNLHCKI